ncbi:MAG: GNAT family N-acetyltransferase [Chthoniobacterales bacterium]
MNHETIITTERLILRTWKEEDVEVYFQINQDPKVIEFLPGSLTIDQVRKFMEAMNRHQQDHSYTLWATELKTSAAMIGFIGLNVVDFEAVFAPATEIGWRLGSQYWGNGYATEGAKAALEYGFHQGGLNEIVSCTAYANLRSQAVMKRLGMLRDMQGDFAHSKLPLDHPLSKHLLYRLRKK